MTAVVTGPSPIPGASGASELSDYERQRLENIRMNDMKLAQLGLLDDAAQMSGAVRAPRQLRLLKRPRPAAPLRDPSQRMSTRSKPLHPAATDAEIRSALQNETHALEAAEEPGAKRQRRGFEWPDARARVTPLLPEQRASLVVGDGWIEDMAAFFEAEGDSDDNRKKVLRVVRQLASGEGVSCSYRHGTFAEGNRISLLSDLEELQQAAWTWLPLKSTPPWMKKPSERTEHYEALCVSPTAGPAEIASAYAAKLEEKETQGMASDSHEWARIEQAYATLSNERTRYKYDWVQLNYKPPPGVALDKSNGWVLNHPLSKMQVYQRHLCVKQNSVSAAVEPEAAAEKSQSGSVSACS